MLVVTDLIGQSEPLTGFTKLTRKRRVNGERTIRFSLFSLPQNEYAYPLVREESLIELNGEEYRIKYVNEYLNGKSLVKDIEANHTFFDLINSRIYTFISGSKSLQEVLDFIFKGTNYTFTIIGNFPNQTWEKFGEDNRLSLLQDTLEFYGVEFERNGTHLTFRGEIGVKLDVQFRYSHNIKTISHKTDSNDLTTYIKGFGKDGLEVEYLSPLHEKYGIQEAPEVRDERYTNADSLLERIKREINDKPKLSITVDYLDLRRNGYPYEVVNEGDYILLIHEPLSIDLEARIVEIEEEFNLRLETINTKVTLSNYSDNTSSDFVAFSKTQKDVNSILEGSKKLPYSVLDDAVQRATEALQSAQTELEFENGIIARSKINPNHLVIITSAGIGVSVDNGATFKTAMTAEGIVADLITVGTMLADRIKGGTFTLGGLDNGNGRMQVLNENGEVIAELDAAKGGFTYLYAADFDSPAVPRYSKEDIKLYVAATRVSTGDTYSDPSDDNSGTSFAEPLATINEALSRIPRYYDGDAIIYIAWGQNLYQDFAFRGFSGKGSITIEGQDKSTTLNGNFTLSNNLTSCKVQNMTVNGKANSYAVGSVIQCSSAFISNVVVNGNNSDRGIDVNQSGYCQIMNSEVYSVTQGILARYGATVWIQNCKGYGSTHGIFAYGGYIMGGGTAPNGAALSGKDYGGQIYPTFTANNGTYVAPPAPETTKIIDSTSGNNWSTQGFWGNDGVKQGNYGYGRRTGLWFFDADILNAIGTGKTIKAMRVYIKRDSKGGSSGGVRHSLRAHGYQTQPGSSPSVSTEIGSATLKWGQGAWITVNSSFFAGFANGTYRGFGVYVNSDSSSLYSILSVAAQVEITYS